MFVSVRCHKYTIKYVDVLVSRTQLHIVEWVDVYASVFIIA